MDNEYLQNTPPNDAATVHKPSEEAPLSFGRWLLELVVLVAFAFVLASGIKAFVVQPFIIPSGSMEDTIQIGDHVLANKFVYRFDDPQPGDIVVFKPWREGGEDLIKRVIAVGGQTIDYNNGSFTVDGVKLADPYVSAQNRETEPGELLPYRVPAGSIFVMGDNRNNSGDSRFNGPVRVDDVLGRAFFTYWPISRMGPLR